MAHERRELKPRHAKRQMLAKRRFVRVAKCERDVAALEQRAVRIVADEKLDRAQPHARKFVFYLNSFPTFCRRFIIDTSRLTTSDERQFEIEPLASTT